jgi:hypothetical protein
MIYLEKWKLFFGRLNNLPDITALIRVRARISVFMIDPRADLLTLRVC